MTLRWVALRANSLLVVLFYLLALPPASAQDPSFSQFYANRTYLNPAFTGLESGLSLSGTYRMQWHRVDQGFRTADLTLETQLPVVRLGLGLHLLSDTEGLGELQTNQAGFLLSYTIPGKENNVHFGMEARMVQKTLDWSKLVFSDQLDPAYGVVNASSVTPVLDRVMYGDFDFGVVWRRVGDLKLGKQKYRDVRSQLGVSFHHLPSLVSKSAKGNDSFLNRDIRVAPRTTFHGGMIIPVHLFQGPGLDIAISPNFKLDLQSYKFLNAKEGITVGTAGIYTLINNFYTGLLYQNRYFAPNGTHTDAFILTVGGYTLTSERSGTADPRLFFGISVDVNSSGVGPAAGSVFEMTFRYRFLPGQAGVRRSSGRSSKRILECRDFF